MIYPCFMLLSIKYTWRIEHTIRNPPIFFYKIDIVKNLRMNDVNHYHLKIAIFVILNSLLDSCFFLNKPVLFKKCIFYFYEMFLVL